MNEYLFSHLEAIGPKYIYEQIKQDKKYNDCIRTWNVNIQSKNVSRINITHEMEKFSLDLNAL